MDSPTYTLREVLALLGLSPSGYHKLRAEGRFPFHPLRPRLGRSDRFPKAPIDAYLRGELQMPDGSTVPTGDFAAQFAYLEHESR